MKKFPKVFGPRTGQMPGEYNIRLNPDVQPVQDAPRRVPVALRDQVKRKLEQLGEQDILALVTTPTDWISSMVEVVKPNGQLRICLDPKNLNKAVQREHFPCPQLKMSALDCMEQKFSRNWT